MEYVLNCKSIEPHDTSFGTINKVSFADDCSVLIGDIIKKHLTPYDEDEAVGRGVHKAQEVYRRLVALARDEKIEIFSSVLFENIVSNYSVNEIERKLDEYENRLRMGDEVMFDGKRCVVMSLSEAGSQVYNAERKIYFLGKSTTNSLVKTGRHFDEMEQLLEKLNDDV